MGFSLPHLLLTLLIILLVFGAGRLPRVMGDLGKGMRALRDGLKDEHDDPKKSTPEPSQKVTAEIHVPMKDATPSAKE